MSVLRMEVESVSAKYMELQREVELLQRQVECMLPLPTAAAGRQQQQRVSGWTSGWRKLGRLGRIQAEQPAVRAAPDDIGSREPRPRRRNSAS